MASPGFSPDFEFDQTLGGGHGDTLDDQGNPISFNEADESLGAYPFKFTGGISQRTGLPVIWMLDEDGNVKPGQTGDISIITKTMESRGATEEQITRFLGQNGAPDASYGADGKISYGSIQLGNGVTLNQGSNGSYSRGTPTSSGNPSGGSVSPTPGGNPGPGPGPAPSPSNPSGGNQFQPPPLQPPAGQPPLGGGPQTGGEQGVVGNITDPGRQGAAGQGFYDTSGLGSPELGSLFDFLPENFNQMTGEERMSALIGAVTRRQEAGLENQVGRFDASQQERLDRGQGTRDLENRILGDTDVMSEGDIQRIAGKQTQRGNQQANVLADALGNRRAGAGSNRSGSAQTERGAIMTGAANAAAQGEADIRAGAREKNFASRTAALGAVGASQRADVGLGLDITRGAAGAIGDAQVFADAFRTQNLFNNGPTGINVNQRQDNTAQGF